MNQTDLPSALIETFIVPKNIHNIRLSDFAFQVFKNHLPSKKSVKKALKKDRIYLNGKIGYSGDYVSEGMILNLYAEQNSNAKPFDLELEILYEDDYLAVVNKPAGIPVSGNYFKTIQNALKANIEESSIIDALSSPLPVHRLDALTSGCLLVAKTKSAQINLGKQFENRKITKKYIAIVSGETPIKGIINLDIQSQEATTEFALQNVSPSLTYGHISFLHLKPITGRTHQLRIHCSALGHPIIGDKLYTKNTKLLKGKGLFLNAHQLTFNHPLINKKLQVESSLPSKFASYLKREETRAKIFNKNLSN